MDDLKFPMAILVPSSHLYQGIHLKAIPATSGQSDTGDIFLLFNDGSEAVAELTSGADNHLSLMVSAYITVRGTSIRAKRWIIKDIVKRDQELDIYLGNHVTNDNEM